MGAILIPIVIVVVALVAGALAVKQFVGRERARADKVYGGGEAMVRYRVPHGQDPAAVLLGLQRAGYEPVLDPVVGHTNELAIARGDHMRLDRDEVRNIFAGITQLNMEGDHLESVPPVRFVDE